MQLGSNKVDKLYLGSNDVTKAYLGSNVVYEEAYSITKSATNGTWSGTSAISAGGTATLTLTPNTNYKLPTSVTVTGATQSWNASTGKLTLSNPTGAVNITATCPIITYSITETLSNVSKSGTHPTSINAGSSVTLKYAANANYNLPDSVTVTGATSTWTKSTGTLTLTNATGAVTITIVGVASSGDDISPGSYTFNDTLDFSAIDDTIKQKLSFTCNAKEYTAMEVLGNNLALNFYYIDSDGIESWSVVYSNNAWSNDSYKEIAIERVQEVDTRIKEFILLNTI